MGYYESIDNGERFHVKRIVVAPGGVLSLQKHRHRAEHRVEARGAPEVTIGDTVRAVHENESIYMPIGSLHRMADQGRIPQTGSISTRTTSSGLKTSISVRLLTGVVLALIWSAAQFG